MSVEIMGSEEIIKYLNALMAGEIKLPPDSELEHNAFKKFATLSSELSKSQERLQQIKEESIAIQTDIYRMSGRIDAFADMLVSAEKSRRVIRNEVISEINKSNSEEVKSNGNKKG